MSSRGLGTVFVLLASWLALGPAPRAVAGEGPTPTAVLGFEPLEGVPEALAADITDAVRQRVAATKE